MEFYAKGLARMEDRWAGTGVEGLGFLELDHPYAADLDIFGKGSLFERLCTARTRAGEEALASWLLAPATHEVLRERVSVTRENAEGTQASERRAPRLRAAHAAQTGR